MVTVFAIIVTIIVVTLVVTKERILGYWSGTPEDLGWEMNGNE